MSKEKKFPTWADENCQNPKKNGQYLCLVKWQNQEEYQYAILSYHKQDGWEVMNNCEHILWTHLPPSPFE